MCSDGQTVSRIRPLIAPLTAVVAACALAAWLVVAGNGGRAAEATVPGFNGKIAFERNEDILVVNPDGSEIANLTNSPQIERYPAWSPDGQQIAFQRGADLWIMDADGSNQTQVTSDGGQGYGYQHPVWHPDGTRIAFVSVREQGDATYVLDLVSGEVSFLVRGGGTGVGGQSSWSPDGTKIAYQGFGPDGAGEIFVANLDGSDPAQVTQHGAILAFWSPDGRIAYTTFIRDNNNEIYVVDADGSNDTNLTNSTRRESLMSWSPDGTRIVYEVIGPAAFESELWMMNADGTNQTRFLPGPSRSSNPDWQALPEDPGYAAFELATPTPMPSVTEFPSGLPAGGGNPRGGSVSLPLVVAGVGLLVIAAGTWYARRRWLG